MLRIYFYSIRGVFSFGLWVLVEGAVLRNVGYSVEVPTKCNMGGGRKLSVLGGGEPFFGNGAILGGEFDTDGAEAFLLGGDECCPASHERVKDESAGGRDESAEVAHEGEWLDGGVVVAGLSSV